MKTYRQRYESLTRSNQVILWIMIIVAMFWPLILRGSPAWLMEVFVTGMVFGGYAIGLLYFGEQKDKAG